MKMGRQRGEAEMGPIVCATRGGEASRRTQERAIVLAKEQGAELFFLCIADPSFAGPVSEPLEAALVEELSWLGRLLLCIAQSRAQEQGVAAQTAIRCGLVWPSIVEYLHETNAGTLIIGLPGTETASRSREFEARFAQFVERIRQSTHVEVVVVT